MTTALAKLTKADTKLSDLEALISAEVEQEIDAYDPVPLRIKIAPGGIGTFVTDDGETFKAFTAIVPVSQKARAYWPSAGSGKLAPMCSSPDGARGYLNPNTTIEQWRDAAGAHIPHPALILKDNGSELPEFYECASCPLAQFGSAHQGNKAASGGQACKSLRRLVVLPERWTQAALLTLPPTSLRAWDGFCTSLAKSRSAYFAYRLKFGLDTDTARSGESYNKIKVEAVEPLNTDEVAAVIEIRHQYADWVRNSPVEAVEYETVQPESDQPAQNSSRKRTRVDATTGEILDAPPEDDRDLPF